MINCVNVGGVHFGGDKLPIIAGPCVIESRDHALKMAEAISEITDSSSRILPLFSASNVLNDLRRNWVSSKIMLILNITDTSPRKLYAQVVNLS